VPSRHRRSDAAVVAAGDDTKGDGWVGGAHVVTGTSKGVDGENHASKQRSELQRVDAVGRPLLLGKRAAVREKRGAIAEHRGREAIAHHRRVARHLDGYGGRGKIPAVKDEGPVGGDNTAGKGKGQPLDIVQHDLPSR